jgi:transposase-like protein
MSVAGEHDIRAWLARLEAAAAGPVGKSRGRRVRVDGGTTMVKTGRPTDFTGEVSRAIIEAIRGGAGRDQAAVAAGVTSSTLYRWLALGRNGTDPQLNQFAAAVNAATREGKRTRRLVHRRGWSKPDPASAPAE